MQYQSTLNNVFQYSDLEAAWILSWLQAGVDFYLEEDVHRCRAAVYQAFWTALCTSQDGENSFRENSWASKISKLSPCRLVSHHGKLVGCMWHVTVAGQRASQCNVQVT